MWLAQPGHTPRALCDKYQKFVNFPVTSRLIACYGYIDIHFSGTWRAKGGLVIFGLPLTQPITQPNGVIVQYFERARFELHPELAGTAYEVQLGHLGVQALEAAGKH